MPNKEPVIEPAEKRLPLEHLKDPEVRAGFRVIVSEVIQLHRGPAHQNPDGVHKHG